MKAFVALLLVGLGLQTLAPLAHACGDKFLVRLDRDNQSIGTPLAAAPRRATILVYRPTSGRAPANSDIEMLQRVGHDVQICDTASRCVTAVNSGAVQVVLADFRDLEGLGIDPRAKARVLPVVSKASRQDVAKVKQRFPNYFDSGAPPGKLLAMVDRMLAE
jgi:hypothetical protein